MTYVEMTVEDAIKICGKHTKVLVAVQNLEREDEEILFERKVKEDYEKLFENVQTVASYMDDFVKQLKCFTEKQDIYNVKPKGVQKIVLLKE